MTALAPHAVLGIADSAFNAAELDLLGCPETAVVPILVDIEPDGASADPCERGLLAAEHGGRTVLLFVGRISPNKAQHRLVEALWLYRRWFDPEARLHLVGPTVTPAYASAVTSFAGELGIGDAVRHGEDLTAAQLAAWYEDADVFVCLSRTRDFASRCSRPCVPGCPSSPSMQGRWERHWAMPVCCLPPTARPRWRPPSTGCVGTTPLPTACRFRPSPTR